MVSYIVAMGENHPSHSTHFFQSLRQRLGKARRIYQHIAARTDDQVTRRSVGMPGGKAAEIHSVRDLFRESSDGSLHRVSAHGSDRPGWASDQRHQSAVN